MVVEVDVDADVDAPAEVVDLGFGDRKSVV